MPDFAILWGEWGHIEFKSGLDRSSGTFCLYGGPLRPVVVRVETKPLALIKSMTTPASASQGMRA